MEHGRELGKERESWFMLLGALPVGSNTEEEFLQFLNEILFTPDYYIGESARGQCEANSVL